MGIIKSIDVTRADKIAAVDHVMNTNWPQFLNFLNKIYPEKRDLDEQNLIETVKEKLVRFVVYPDLQANSDQFANVWRIIRSVRGDDGDLTATEWNLIYDYLLDYLWVRIGVTDGVAFYKNQKVSSEAIERIKNIALSTTNKPIITSLHLFERMVLQGANEYIETLHRAAKFGLVPRETKRKIDEITSTSHSQHLSTSNTSRVDTQKKTNIPSAKTAKEPDNSICNGCGSNPLKQAERKEPVCVLFDKNTNTRPNCVFWTHPDVNRHGLWKDSATKKAYDKINVKLKNGKSFHPSWIVSKHRLKRDTNKKIIEPPAMEKNEVTPESITLLENNIAPTNMANSHTQSSRDADSPWIHAKICDSLFTRALLDTCSSGPRLLLTNYISSRVVDNIKLIELKNKTPIISNCTCSRAVTHTQAGTFETATCIHLNLTLFRDDNKVENKRISFRVKNGLSEDMIIGIHTIRELDLSKVFRPLFINPQILQHTDHEHEHEQPPAVEQNIQTPPTSHESEVSVSNSVSHNTRSVTRRAEMLNRSSCTNNLQTTIVSTEAESRPDISLRVAECSEPWRGTNFLNDLNIVDKSIYLDIEEDFDPLDELSPENPAEAFINDSNDGWDIAPEEDRIKYILHNIESPDVRKAMRPVLTSFIKVFRKELPNEPSLLPPFKLELNEHNDALVYRQDQQTSCTYSGHSQTTRSSEIYKKSLDYWTHSSKPSSILVPSATNPKEGYRKMAFLHRF